MAFSVNDKGSYKKLGVFIAESIFWWVSKNQSEYVFLKYGENSSIFKASLTPSIRYIPQHLDLLPLWWLYAIALQRVDKSLFNSEGSKPSPGATLHFLEACKHCLLLTFDISKLKKKSNKDRHNSWWIRGIINLTFGICSDLATQAVINCVT